MARSSRSQRRLTRSRTGVLLAFCFFFSIAALLLRATQVRSTPVASTGILTAWVFDVGQGDAIFLELPTGEQLLIDGGPGASVLEKLGIVLPPWDRTLDAIILTHPHLDHVAGLIDVFDRYEVRAVYESGATHKTNAMEEFETAITKEGSVHTLVQDGADLWFGEVHIQFIAPDQSLDGWILEDPNMGSVVVLVTYGDTTLLFTGDAPAELEGEILDDLGVPIDVLKVAHHGSVYSTTNAFLSVTAPQAAIISVGKNSYGHPHPVLLERLYNRAIAVYRTDLDGDIRVTSTGGEPDVQAIVLP